MFCLSCNIPNSLLPLLPTASPPQVLAVTQVILASICSLFPSRVTVCKTQLANWSDFPGMCGVFFFYLNWKVVNPLVSELQFTAGNWNCGKKTMERGNYSNTPRGAAIKSLLYLLPNWAALPFSSDKYNSFLQTLSHSTSTYWASTKSETVPGTGGSKTYIAFMKLAL